MLKVFIMRIVQVYDHFRIKGFRLLFKEVFYYKRKAKIIEKDLCEVKLNDDPLKKNGIEFKELNLKELSEEPYYFKYRNRFLKAMHYLKTGYGGHFLIKGYEIIGSVYFFPINKKVLKKLHEDIKLFRLEWNESYVYSFDTFIDPEYRGNNVAAAFLNSHLFDFYRKGFKKAYGYYWDDNLPAKWNARVLNKWGEINEVFISRFFIKRIMH